MAVLAEGAGDLAVRSLLVALLETLHIERNFAVFVVFVV